MVLCSTPPLHRIRCSCEGGGWLKNLQTGMMVVRFEARAKNNIYHIHKHYILYTIFKQHAFTLILYPVFPTLYHEIPSCLFWHSAFRRNYLPKASVTELSCRAAAVTRSTMRTVRTRVSAHFRADGLSGDAATDRVIRGGQYRHNGQNTQNSINNWGGQSTFQAIRP